MSSAAPQPALFTPLTIRGLTLKNRLVMSPMCMFQAKDGVAQDFHIVHLGSRAAGGIGLVWVEATGVVAEGRISPYCTGLWNDQHVEAFKKVVSVVHGNGAKIGIQIGHSGRKGSCHNPWQGYGVPIAIENGGWQIVAPSAIAFDAKSSVPKELTEAEIQDLVNSFAHSAQLAVKAGFDTIEIHGAHGYLIHEFLSPISNKRTDKYGGSFENRTRFISEIVTAVRKVIPESMPLFTRLSCEDWMEGGWTVEESVKLSEVLKGLGVDVIDCSGGFISGDEKPRFGVCYQVKYAEAVKKCGVLTGAVGGIATAKDANAIIAEGKADLAFIGKTLLVEPYFALKAAQELEMEKNTVSAMYHESYGWVRRYMA